MFKPMKKPQVKQYFVSSVMVLPIHILMRVTDAVEHGDQTGDSTVHTRVNHCDFDVSNVEAENESP